MTRTDYKSARAGERTSALVVIAMSVAKKQSRISPYFILHFSGLLRLAPRNDGYAERTGLSFIARAGL
jgi:hypothetical protein